MWVILILATLDIKNKELKNMYLLIHLKITLLHVNITDMHVMLITYIKTPLIKKLKVIIFSRTKNN